ncbi:MAG: tetratricopeptide repeat protein [Lachnospiraceae bacterium]|nr:tetratricopeptide repeat protein [Lachnospiraceae bacterium]
MRKFQKNLTALFLGLTILTFGGCGKEDSGSYQRAMEALENGNYSLAQQEFMQAEKLDHRPAEVARGKGLLFLAQGQYDQAMKLFDQAIEKGGSSKSFVRDVKLYQAETCLAKGETSEAENICQELLEESHLGEAELILGRIALSKGEYDAAEEHFVSCVSEHPSFDNYLTIYTLYVNASMEADGAAYLERALELVPADAEDYCSQGQIYYHLGQTEQAKTSFARAIDLGNTDAVPMMGKLYLENGEIQAARSMYQSYLNEALRPALAYNGLALCDLADKKYDEALVNIRKGLEEEDTEVRESLLLNEIAAYEYKLDFSQAKAKMQAFLEEYPENKEALRENLFLKSR